MYSRPVFDPKTVIGNTFAELEVLHELCSSGEAALNQQLEELHGKMDEDIAGLDAYGEEGYLSDINDHYVMVSLSMPMYQNYAYLTLGFALFEKCLNDVSMQIRDDRNFPLSLKDIHGQGIARAKVYLSKVCGITSPFQTAAWSRALLLAEIRNAISHRGGFIDHKPDDIRSLYTRLAKFPEIELDHVWDVADQPDRQIGFDNSFVVVSLKSYTDVLQSLWKAL
ncbi:MAG: hypothetical protein WBA02_13520 [Jannaschia helgolandensis]|uniref:hypothetical protein n=1 Tax=Jannaschia helgolandensis TaxID=188906 RepID=UPI003C716788